MANKEIDYEKLKRGIARRKRSLFIVSWIIIFISLGFAVFYQDFLYLLGALGGTIGLQMANLIPYPNELIPIKEKIK